MDISSLRDEMARYAGEKGSCDLFPTLVHTRSIEAGMFRGKLVFVGMAEVREPYVQKHNLHTTKQKTGVIPRGAKKWVLGMFFAYRFGDERLIDHVSIGRISIYTAIGIGVYLDSCISHVQLSEHLYIWICVYAYIYIATYLDIPISGYMYIYMYWYLHSCLSKHRDIGISVYRDGYIGSYRYIPISNYLYIGITDFDF